MKLFVTVAFAMAGAQVLKVATRYPLAGEASTASSDCDSPRACLAGSDQGFVTAGDLERAVARRCGKPIMNLESEVGHGTAGRGGGSERLGFVPPRLPSCLIVI